MLKVKHYSEFADADRPDFLLEADNDYTLRVVRNKSFSEFGKVYEPKQDADVFIVAERHNHSGALGPSVKFTVSTEDAEALAYALLSIVQSYRQGEDVWPDGS